MTIQKMLSAAIFSSALFVASDAWAFNTQCERKRDNFVELTEDYRFAAYAAGRGNTISGIAGCALIKNNTSLASAKRRALYLCKNAASTRNKGCKIRKTKP